MKLLFFLEARKKIALERFVARMSAARKRPLPASAEEAFLQGMREGYAEGLADGIQLGAEAETEAKQAFSSGLGLA